MIETKEQYEEIKDYLWNDSWASQPYVSECTSSIVETIEALREVARAGRDCIYGKEPLSVDEADLRGQLAALPDWITDG